MKPTRIFTICLIATLVLFFVQLGQGHEPYGPQTSKTFSLCVLFAVLLQLAVFASSRASRLRWVSMFWMVVALILASAETSRLMDLTAVFFAGFVFSFFPPERPVPAD
ncbi:MAG: hypothetical protein CMJ89_10365 [Planctomycetes bacterium]|jgi:uncharacterized membrane protein|nr:hypothetical protein [Planctomycetota bacterium]